MPRTTRTPALPDDPAAACETLAASCTEKVRTLAENYRAYGISKSDWAAAGPLVRLALLALAPKSRNHATNLGWTAAVHVRACLARGADRTVTGVWASEQVEHTLASKLPVGDTSRASMAAVLRRVSRELVPAGQPLQALKHPRSANLGPYRSGEFAGLVDVVTTIAAPLWRARASLLVALGAGAGITNADAALLEPDDVTPTRHGLLVSVRASARARVIPVRHELEQLAAAAHTALLAAAAADPRADGGRLFPGDDAASRLFSQLTWPPGVARSNTHRLRATWSTLTFASGCGLPAYLRAAHITSLDSWMAPTALLPQLPLDVYCAQVRGATGPFAPDGSVLDGQPWPAPAIPLRDDDTRATRRPRAATKRGGR